MRQRGTGRNGINMNQNTVSHPGSQPDSPQTRPGKAATEQRGEIRRNRLPNWLRKRIVANYDVNTFSRSHCEGVVADWLRGGVGRNWLDHWGTVRDGDLVNFVSEPYGIGGSGLRDLVEFCDRIDCRFRISARSTWNPGRTILITIYEPIPSEEVGA